jgi:hypothetical protein
VNPCPPLILLGFVEVEPVNLPVNLGVKVGRAKSKEQRLTDYGLQDYGQRDCGLRDYGLTLALTPALPQERESRRLSRSESAPVVFHRTTRMPS